jgi:hypothetical protein
MDSTRIYWNESNYYGGLQGNRMTQQEKQISKHHASKELERDLKHIHIRNVTYEMDDVHNCAHGGSQTTGLPAAPNYTYRGLQGN